jgi:hypothetical protein
MQEGSRSPAHSKEDQHTVSEAFWRQQYAEALARAEVRAEAARASGKLIACAFSSNVDRVGTLDDGLSARWMSC